MQFKAKKVLRTLLVLVVLMAFLSTTALAAPINFSDVAKSAWYYNDVQKAVDSGLVNGYPDNTFGPSKNMTYAEAIKLAATMYKMAATGSNEFETGTPWYQPYVDYAKNVGIISKDYAWNSPATRAGYMEIFAKAIPDKPAMAGIKALDAINTIPNGSIPDVPMTHPQAAAIYKLYRAGILQGSDAQHNCKPNSNIQRSEVAAILTRMMNASERISFSMEQTAELKITSQPQAATINVGQDATFSVTVSGGKTPYKYEWHRLSVVTSQDQIPDDPEWFSGIGTASLVTKDCAAKENGDRYYCVITDANGKKVTSDKATLTVKEATLSITSQPKSATVNVGQDATFSVTASGGKTPYTYVWHKISPEGKEIDFSALQNATWYSGADSATLLAKRNIMSTDNGAKFYCVITDADGNSVTSNQATLTVKEAALSISTQPKSVTVNNGATATFTVAASGGKTPYKYVWKMISTYDGKEYGISEGNIYLGTNSDTLTVDTSKGSVNSGLQYLCIVTDADGNRVTSDKATITVKEAGPSISTQPMSITINSGSDAVFAVKVSGGKTPYKYEWHCIFPSNGDRVLMDNSWFSGTKTDTVTSKSCTVDTDNGSKFYCVVTDANGNSVTSNKATLTVKDAALSVSTQPMSLTVSRGSTAVFSVKASGGKAPYSYYWQMVSTIDGKSYGISETGGYYSGTNTPTLSVNTTDINSGIKYFCIIIDDDGNRVTSNQATLTIN